MGNAEGSGNRVRVLYISYDGLLEPLGQSQILPYLDWLSSPQLRLFLLTFEKRQTRETNREREALGKRLAQRGILWTPLRYHKTPTIAASLYDILVGVVVGAIISRRHKVQIVHARSYVPAFIALVLKVVLGVKFLFDMRGFWADERVDGKLWKAGGALYYTAKAFERLYLKQADAVVTLTEAARKEIETFEYLKCRTLRVAVIPTCVDLDRFQMQEQAGAPYENSRLEERLTLVYSGSVGTWYALDEMAAFFSVMKKRVSNAHFLILTPSPRRLVEQIVRKYAVDGRDTSIQSLPYQRVAGWIALSDVGIIFSRPSWANRARCPTKLAEFLACGVPVIVSRGIGDTAALIEKERVGIVVEEFSEAAYEEALAGLRRLLSEAGVRKRCRQVAERYFSLEKGVLRYHEVYQGLTEVCLRPPGSGYSS